MGKFFPKASAYRRSQVSSDMSTATNIRIIQAMFFPETLHGHESQTLKKQNERNTGTFDSCLLERTLENTVDSYQKE